MYFRGASRQRARCVPRVLAGTMYSARQGATSDYIPDIMGNQLWLVPVNNITVHVILKEKVVEAERQYEALLQCVTHSLLIAVFWPVTSRVSHLRTK